MYAWAVYLPTIEGWLLEVEVTMAAQPPIWVERPCVAGHLHGYWLVWYQADEAWYVEERPPEEVGVVTWEVAA